ncbi:MAG: 50S ribosomal protein L35ae [Candidatus Altiarchaeales archaeon]|nr:50S ribosomal protein L35ae [Candidatus Altiarchaeales archaeon]
MKATVINYRGGKRTQKVNQFILSPEKSKNKEEASKLLGKKVEWTTPAGKKLVGEVTRIHGNSGAVVARFEKGLPGQALGTAIEIQA